MGLHVDRQIDDKTQTPKNKLQEICSLQTHLEKFAKAHGDLAFSGNEGRDFAHDIVQYPAMMVPRMQGELLDCFRGDDGRSSLSVIDPFMGSGTILVEALRRGLEFRGIDINPYAFLISSVKATTLSESQLDELVVDIKKVVDSGSKQIVEHDFSGRDKWFRKDVSKELSCIRQGISKVESLEKRLVLWACLGETIRVSSNSRTSTFKLHIRSSKDRGRDVDAIATFNTTVERVVGLLKAERACRELVVPTPELHLGCVEDVDPTQADLLISSPPYGDNRTTVPYGQFSYLALQWIDLKDIPGASSDVVKNTHALDTQSLGGGLRDVLDLRQSLEEQSSTLADFLSDLEPKDTSDGVKRVLAFYRDLNAALDCCVGFVKPRGYMVWTVGNRRVCGQTVPMDEILLELLEARECKFVMDLKRIIPSKRMATKNSTTETMRSETVVIVQNGE